MHFLCFQTLLQNLSAEEVRFIVNTKTGGSTPLVMACRNGHLEIAKFLVMRCKADLEITGSGKLELGNTVVHLLKCRMAARDLEGTSIVGDKSDFGNDELVAALVRDATTRSFSNSTPVSR